MLWIAGVCALCMLVCLPFFMHYKHHTMRYRLAAAYKFCGTLCAAILALIAAIRLDPRCWICFVALMLHATADYILEFNLWIGAGFFLAGHICYIAFFTTLFPPTSVHLICAVCLMAIMVYLFFFRWRKQIGKRLPLFAVYGGALCLMCACAIGCMTGHTLQGQIIMIAGALFFISDTMICCRILFTAGRGIDWAVMITYYAAQLLFGISCLLG